MIFAALGDETRLLLVSRLSSGAPHSITQLTNGLNLTRQGVTKHLRVLESVGIAHGVRKGRENRFELNLQPFQEVQDYIELVSKEWDRTLGRLKSFVEE